MTCPDRLEGAEADALLVRFGSAHHAIVAQGEGMEWDVRCPVATPTTMEVVVAQSPSPAPGRKPCQGRVTVTVTVKTGDGALDRTFGGWLEAGGRIVAEAAPWITLPSRPEHKLSLQGLGYHTVEPCCAEPPTAEHRRLLALVQSSGLQKLTFPDLTTDDKTRSNELEVRLAPFEPRNACGVTVASFELVDRAHQVAAAGTGDLKFGASRCSAPDEQKVCGSFELGMSAHVRNHFALVGYAGGQRLETLDGFVQGLVAADEMHSVRMSFEVSGNGPVGIVMSTDP